MTLNEHIAAGPQWVYFWVTWLGIVNIASVLFLFGWKDGRPRFGHIEVVFILAALAGNILMIEWLFRSLGYVRLLGLAHVVFWTPLAVYLWRRLRHHPPPSVFGVYLRILLATILVSLAFDYVDAVRYLAGDTAMG